MRYLREYKEAEARLSNLREKAAKSRIPANEPGQLIETKTTLLLTHTDPEPGINAPEHSQLPSAIKR